MYEKSLEIGLVSVGLRVQRQVRVPVWFREQRVGDFAADMLIDDCVLLELKAARALDSSHEAQLLNYLRATQVEVGLLLNFGIKAEFKRMAFDNSRKQIRENPRLSAAILLSDE